MSIISNENTLRNAQTNQANALLIPALSATFWMTLFLFFHRQSYFPAPHGMRYMWANMINSIIHSSFITIFAILFLTQQISLARWRHALNITRGYFLYDILCVIIFPNVSDSSQQSFFYIFHHIFLLLAIALLTNYPRTIAIGFLSEIPIPFLSVFWYLDQWQAYDATLYYPLGVCTLVLYFIFRVCNLTYLFISRVQIKKDNMHVKAMTCIPILLLNYYWFYFMTKEALKILQ